MDVRSSVPTLGVYADAPFQVCYFILATQGQARQAAGDTRKDDLQCRDAAVFCEEASPTVHRWRPPSPATVKRRSLVRLAVQRQILFLTPRSQTPFSITTCPIIEGPPEQEIEVTHTRSHRVTGEATISYFASLCAKLARTSAHRYRITEREIRAGSTRGLHAVNLRFHENNVLRKGLNGERRVSIRMDDVEGVTSICCTLTARVKYTAVRTFGLITSHLENIDTTFTLAL